MGKIAGKEGKVKGFLENSMLDSGYSMLVKEKGGASHHPTPALRYEMLVARMRIEL
jgi:hypothetical protein